MKQYKVYADTSVFGGCFDEEFKIESLEFITLVKNGVFKLLVSPLLVAEISKAPEFVRSNFESLDAEKMEFCDFNEEIARLRDAYLNAQVLTNKSKSDAEHISYATIYNADLVVSWNFKHIVHFEKISGFNAVNMLNGYRTINIYSPREVV